MLNLSELRILSFVVASRLPPNANGTIVIGKTPMIERSLPNIAAYRKFGVFDKFPSLSEDTVSDLLAKEGTGERFEQAFALPRATVFLDDTEARQLFPRGADWKLFYEKYPDSGGVFHVSRAGWNAAGDQALVHVGRQWVGRAGNGSLVLLRVNDNTIAEIGEVSTWTS